MSAVQSNDLNMKQCHNLYRQHYLGCVKHQKSRIKRQEWHREFFLPYSLPKPLLARENLGAVHAT